MKRLWSTDELAERWTLSADDLRLTVDHGEQAKLGLMCQLAFWREHARFPEVEADIAPAVVAHLARQIGVSAEVLEGYDFAGRSGRRHRRMVVAHLAVREFGDEEEAVFRTWLLADCLPAEPAPLALEEAVASWFARERILRPGGYRFDRLVRSARAAHDDAVLAMIAGRLDDPRARASRCSARRRRHGYALYPPVGRSWQGRPRQPVGRDRQARRGAWNRFAARPALRSSF